MSVCQRRLISSNLSALRRGDLPREGGVDEKQDAPGIAVCSVLGAFVREYPRREGNYLLAVPIIGDPER